MEIGDDGLTRLMDNYGNRQTVPVPEGQLGQALRTEFDKGPEVRVSITLSLEHVHLRPPYPQVKVFTIDGESRIVSFKRTDDDE